MSYCFNIFKYMPVAITKHDKHLGNFISSDIGVVYLITAGDDLLDVWTYKTHHFSRSDSLKKVVSVFKHILVKTI